MDPGLDLLLAALASPRVAATGPRFRFPEIDIVPRPYTRPRPEVVVAVTTAPTAKLAAQRGLPMLLGMHANDSEKGSVALSVIGHVLGVSAWVVIA